jgi:hypothetical protein
MLSALGKLLQSEHTIPQAVRERRKSWIKLVFFLQITPKLYF